MISGGKEGLVYMPDFTCKSVTLTSAIDVNDDGKLDFIQQEIDEDKSGGCERTYLALSGWRKKIFGFPTDSKASLGSFWGGPGRFSFVADEMMNIGGSLAKEDLVQVPFSSRSNVPVSARVLGFYLEFDPSTKSTRKMVRVDLGNHNVDVFQLDAVTLISKVADLEQKAGPVIAKMKRAHQRDWNRREELLGYADFEHLKKRFRDEVTAIERRLFVTLDQEVNKLDIDEPGKGILLRKVKEQAGIQMRVVVASNLSGNKLGGILR